MKAGLPTEYLNWCNALKQSNCRGIMLIYQNRAFLQQLNSNHLENNTTCINSNSFSSPKQYLDHILGNEFEAILFDATNQFDANFFAASIGSLIGGGIVYIVIDNNETVPIDFQFTGKAINLDNSISIILKKVKHSHLLHRLLQNANNQQQLSVMMGTHLFVAACTETSSPNNINQYAEQDLLIKKIKRIAIGHSRRPLVITANRGRGKSAALGIATSQLLKDLPIEIVVTAPGKSQLQSFFKHLDLPMKGKNQLILENGSSLSFIPIDQIISTSPSARVLIVDEAAAIPVTQLEALIHKYNRLIFSTTTHGYEGNGKGFEIRFKHKLLTKFKQTSFVELNQPIRWSPHDRLEELFLSAFVLNTALTALPQTNSNISQLTNRTITKQELKDDENLLVQVFSLLINAHYQTRPADLEQIFSNPNIFVSALCDNHNVICAVALVCVEGGLSKQTADDIDQGKHRVIGHLLPQSLTAHLGLKHLAENKFYRIMRIAVHPELRRKGLGSLLISNLVSLARKNSIDYLGASFAVESYVIQFWLKNRFSTIRFGSAKDSSSGQNTAEVLLALTEKAKENLMSIESQFERQFFYRLNGQYKKLENEVILLLIAHQFKQKYLSLTAQEIHEIEMFKNSVRSSSMVDWSLAKLLKIHLCRCHSPNLLNNDDYYFLIDFLLKQLSKSRISVKYKLTGRKQIELKLRTLTRVLLQDNISNL